MNQQPGEEVLRVFTNQPTPCTFLNFLLVNSLTSQKAPLLFSSLRNFEGFRGAITNNTNTYLFLNILLYVAINHNITSVHICIFVSPMHSRSCSMQSVLNTCGLNFYELYPHVQTLACLNTFLSLNTEMLNFPGWLSMFVTVSHHCLTNQKVIG